MKKTRQLKRYAREMLEGNYGTAILALVVYEGTELLANFLTNAFFGGTGIFDIIISQVFAFGMALITGIVAAGQSYMFLNMARGKKFSVKDLFYFFRNHPDRVIVAGFVLAVISVVVSIPYYYVSFTTEMGTTLEQQAVWVTKTQSWLLAALVLQIVLSIPFSMAYYLLADDVELDGMDAIRASVRMMKGNIGRYLGMIISFVPLILLSTFTLYIALLWLIPYMQMTIVMFYRDLRGEFDYYPPQEIQQNL